MLEYVGTKAFVGDKARLVSGRWTPLLTTWVHLEGVRT